MDRVDDHAALVGSELGSGLRLARDEHPARRVRHGGRGDELLQIAREASLEGTRRVDRGRVDGDERLAQVGGASVLNRPRMFGPESGSAEDAGQHVHRERQAVALVAGRRLLAAERMERAPERGLGVVAGSPSASIAQPTGSVSPRRAATSIRPRGTVDVAMSRQNVPNRPAGAAIAIGFVPISGWRARVGATSGEVFDSAMPIMPAAAARSAYQPAIPKWFEP